MAHMYHCACHPLAGTPPLCCNRERSSGSQGLLTSVFGQSHCFWCRLAVGACRQKRFGLNMEKGDCQAPQKPVRSAEHSRQLQGFVRPEQETVAGHCTVSKLAASTPDPCCGHQDRPPMSLFLHHFPASTVLKPVRRLIRTKARPVCKMEYFLSSATFLN